VKLDDCRADTLEKFLDSAQAQLLPAHVTGLLATRLKANKASVAKYSAVLKGTGSDGRIRGLINHYAAGTGRDGGRRFQPQNLARPVLLNKKFTMDDAVAVVKGGLAEILFEEPLQLLSDTVRGVLIPEAGRKFSVADLASIEGRILPWMMGEDWKTQYFRDLDAGLVKYDGYELAYATAFGVEPETVTKEQRTLGKPIELATGFGGGVGALITFAAVYGIDLDDMARKAYGAADPYLWQECDKSYDWFLKMKLTMDLDRFTWTGCQYIVKAWRNKHPAIVSGWARIEDAFRNALHNPGTWFEACRGAHMMNNGGWIFLSLPSQRMLVYPHVHEVERNGRKQLAYMGVNPFSHKWGSIYTYGGKLTENIDQAIARDVLFDHLPAVEAAGYPVNMRVHDELITEPLDTPDFSGEHLARMIATPHSWCADLPLNAEGADLTRYQK